MRRRPCAPPLPTQVDFELPLAPRAADADAGAADAGADADAPAAVGVIRARSEPAVALDAGFALLPHTLRVEVRHDVASV